MLMSLHDLNRQRPSKRILWAIVRSLIVLLIIAVIMILIILLTPSPSVSAQEWSNPRCQPACPPACPQEEKEIELIFYPVYIREEIKEEIETAECANHFVELGFYAHANEVGSTGFPSHNFLIGSVGLRSKRFQDFLDVAGGISFGSIQNQGAIGINLKLGVPFANPGPSFDFLRASWMVNNAITLVSKRVGVRIPLLKMGPFGEIQALGYVGLEAFAFYSEPTGYTEGYSILVGVAAEVCRESFSFGCFVEFHACQQKWECSSHKGTASIEVGVQLWLF